MPQLISPTTRLHAAWLEAHAEWGPGQHEDGFGLRPSDEVESAAGFAAWVSWLASRSGAVEGVGGHRCLYRWIVEDDRVLGGMALRYGSDDYVRWAGHIGYGIRPSARRRGLASWALGEVLNEARAVGLDRVLVVCAVDNLASGKTIERCSGVFESIRDSKFGPVRRYWIDLERALDRDQSIGCQKFLPGEPGYLSVSVNLRHSSAGTVSTAPARSAVSRTKIASADLATSAQLPPLVPL